MDMEKHRHRQISYYMADLVLGFSVFLFFVCTCNGSISLDGKKGGGLSSSSILFPVSGNVYPLGYYSVTVQIGNPPKKFDMDIDTGSDITWIQCDAPCKGCTKARHELYKPKNNVVFCKDPLCSAITPHCQHPNEQCDYTLQYADQGSSLGVLVSDTFHLNSSNGSGISPPVTFGCGYDHHYNGRDPPSTSGVLALGGGKASINSQLHTLGVIENVVGHCFGENGGYLFLGRRLVPPEIKWIPSPIHPTDMHYTSGPAEFLFDGTKTDLLGLYLTFDSGSSYSYLNSKAYGIVLNLIRSQLDHRLKPAEDDNTLPVCWKGSKPFKSFHELKGYFKSMSLNFKKVKNTQFPLDPSDYLILSKKGNVCFGILNGTEVGLGDANVIGDIFMRDKVVVYDINNRKVGWAYGNCRKNTKFQTDL